MYNNEREIGVALAKIFAEGEFTRADVFLVSKFFSDKRVATKEAVRESLAALQTEYIDLYYLHYSASPPDA